MLYLSFQHTLTWSSPKNLQSCYSFPHKTSVCWSVSELASINLRITNFFCFKTLKSFHNLMKQTFYFCPSQNLLFQISRTDERKLEDAIIWSEEVECISSSSFPAQALHWSASAGCKWWFHCGKFPCSTYSFIQLFSSFTHLQIIHLPYLWFMPI